MVYTTEENTGIREPTYITHIMHSICVSNVFQSAKVAIGGDVNSAEIRFVSYVSKFPLIGKPLRRCYAQNSFWVSYGNQQYHAGTFCSSVYYSAEHGLQRDSVSN
jgi:hypothetical protein